LKDYMKNDLSALGVRLDTEDLEIVYKLFADYTRMKKSARELDDSDVASLLSSQ